MMPEKCRDHTHVFFVVPDSFPGRMSRCHRGSGALLFLLAGSGARSEPSELEPGG